MPIGSKVELGLLRDGKPVTVTVELQQSNQTRVDSSTIFNGIEGAEMSNKGQDKGVVVNNVKAGTPAAQIGLKKGDVIVGANQQPVKNIADLRKIFDAKPSVLALNIQRGDALSICCCSNRQRSLPSPFLAEGRGFSFCDRPTTPHISPRLSANAQCSATMTLLCWCPAKGRNTWLAGILIPKWRRILWRGPCASSIPIST